VSKTIWDRIEERRSRWNVLEHPFYTRWTAGELSRDELARYSGQYRHAVLAVAEMSATAARQAVEGVGEELRTHAAEEAAHVGLWDGFVKAVGGDPAARPTAETTDCVSDWTAEDGLLATLTRLYAIESGQPEISRLKREGLVSLYGVPDGPATEYFRVHESADIEHAAHSRRLIESSLGDAEEGRLEAAAEGAFRANWRLLDGVR
jgi:pyrroloquinoline-quinone synthase